MADKKFSASEIVRHALSWGEESIAAMIDAHTSADGVITDSKHVAYLQGLLKQMRAYRNKRFGPKPDHFAGTHLVDAFTMKPVLHPIKDVSK